MPMPSASAAGGDAPDSNWRGIVSLALFIHFFGVALALVSYTAASPLEQRVLEILPQLKFLNFDFTHGFPTPARYYQTHAMEGDIDFICDVTAILPDGSKQTVVLPPPGVRPPVRFGRYQSLVNAMGNLVGSNDSETTLPKAIAASVLARAGARRGEIVLTGHNLPAMEDLKSSLPAMNDPLSSRYLRKAYEADVIVAKDSVSVKKRSEAFEVAPVDRGAKGARMPGNSGARP